jgi:hypothetical protein
VKKILRVLDFAALFPPVCLLFGLVFCLPSALPAQTACAGAPSVLVQPPYNGSYSCANLGSVPGVPPNYGGLTLKYDDPNTLLIGGGANSVGGRIYGIGVVRQPVTNRITGFTGVASLYPGPGSTVGQNNDGGVTFGPSNVLFVARYNLNQLEQTKVGSNAPDKVISLTPLGVASSIGAVGIIPTGFPGAGQIVFCSYNASTWYRATLTPDGTGTFDVTGVTPAVTIGGGPEGVAFVPPGSPLFAPNSVLIARYSAGTIVTMTLNSGGDPIPASAQNVVTGLVGAEGAFIDPLTGDFLFSTFGGSNQVVRVSGFLSPTAASVPVGGRVWTSGGIGLRGAIVTITDSKGQSRSAVTSSFGYYRFDSVVVGETYVVSVSSKRYQFQSTTITLQDELTDLDFMPVSSSP